jgi:hypothetical protein
LDPIGYGLILTVALLPECTDLFPMDIIEKKLGSIGQAAELLRAKFR